MCEGWEEKIRGYVLIHINDTRTSFATKLLHSNFFGLCENTVIYSKFTCPNFKLIATILIVSTLVSSNLIATWEV